MDTTASAAAAADSTLYYKAVGSIAIYFVTVISALVVCIARTRFSAQNAVYILIALSSLLTTWYYIISWFQKEYESFGSDFDRFLLESDLFVQAYAIVTNTLPKWWWSSQLLILTGTALTCWSVEGQSLRLENTEKKRASYAAAAAAAPAAPAAKTKSWTPTRWFVLLGFFGSMSVGGPLFLAQLDPKPKTRPQARSVPTLLALLILAGEASVIATPLFKTMSTGFTYNLILTHALFLVPSLISFNPDTHKRFSTVSLPTLYSILALIAFVSHIMYTLPFVISPIMQPRVLYNALWFNHCQTSISADLVFNNILAAVYMIQSSRQLKKLRVGLVLSLVMPVLSVSTVLPLYLSWKERQSVDKQAAKVKDAKKKE
ncbi:asparagine-linked glycosylation protein [Dissophora globulifera]|uniref:Asparagine-linked glycosylation protein n=1 Tax=Dissophora globulifera TaxID=979702 RepID=A0A9P6RFH2_9FUNG|nr:asparagine-linked glycosylation protein [Dissophora globulifera]